MTGRPSFSQGESGLVDHSKRVGKGSEKGSFYFVAASSPFRVSHGSGKGDGGNLCWARKGVILLLCDRVAQSVNVGGQKRGRG